MTNLLDEVVPVERVVFCTRCRDQVVPKVSWAGPHLRGDCPRCGRYVKFLKQVAEHPRYAEPDLYETGDIESDKDDVPW